MWGWSGREAESLVGHGKSLDSILSGLEAIKDRNVTICSVMNGLKNSRSGSWTISQETIAMQGTTVAETGVVNMEMERSGYIGVHASVSLAW